MLAFFLQSKRRRSRRGRLGHAEHAHHFGQLVRLGAQALGGRGALLDQRGVLLRDLVKLVHRMAHLADACGLLAGNYQLLLATSGSAPKGGHFHSDGTFHAEDH